MAYGLYGMVGGQMTDVTGEAVVYPDGHTQTVGGLLQGNVQEGHVC